MWIISRLNETVGVNTFWICNDILNLNFYPVLVNGDKIQLNSNNSIVLNRTYYFFFIKNRQKYYHICTSYYMSPISLNKTSSCITLLKRNYDATVIELIIKFCLCFTLNTTLTLHFQIHKGYLIRVISYSYTRYRCGVTNN